MKVVRPEWIAKSVKAGVLQRWQDFALQPGAIGSLPALGQGTNFSGASGQAAIVDVDQTSIKAPQKTLTDAFATQKRSQSARNSKSSTSHNSAEPSLAPLGSATMGKQLFNPPSPVAVPSKSVPNNRTPTKRFQDIEEPPSPTGLAPGPNSSESAPDAGEDQESGDQPSYAMYDSNPVAAKLMESTEWRRQHTSANPQAFTESYFQNSRLHHLSTWKSELRRLVAEAREEAEKAEESAMRTTESELLKDADMTSMQGAQLPRMLVAKRDKGKAKESDRVIMHVDFDSFFVAAGLVDRPQLRGKPVVVCHSGAGKVSTSEIASASYEARTFGIKNGMS